MSNLSIAMSEVKLSWDTNNIPVTREKLQSLSGKVIFIYPLFTQLKTIIDIEIVSFKKDMDKVVGEIATNIT